MKKLGGFVFDAKNKCGNKNETQQYQINFTINLEVWEILRNCCKQNTINNINYGNSNQGNSNPIR